MTVDEACEIIAKHALHTVDADWADYPDIGEYAWDHIRDLIVGMKPEIDVEEYEEAYALLTERADK